MIETFFFFFACSQLTSPQLYGLFSFQLQRCGFLCQTKMSLQHRWKALSAWVHLFLPVLFFFSIAAKLHWGIQRRATTMRRNTESTHRFPRFSLPLARKAKSDNSVEANNKSNLKSCSRLSLVQKQRSLLLIFVLFHFLFFFFPPLRALVAVISLWKLTCLVAWHCLRFHANMVPLFPSFVTRVTYYYYYFLFFFCPPFW